MAAYVIIEKAFCNKREIRLVRSKEFEPHYLVREPGNWNSDEAAEFDNYNDAKNYFDEAIVHWKSEPNWEAQREYDEAHGTINGYAPYQYEMVSAGEY